MANRNFFNMDGEEFFSAPEPKLTEKKRVKKAKGSPAPKGKTSKAHTPAILRGSEDEYGATGSKKGKGAQYKDGLDG